MAKSKTKPGKGRVTKKKAKSVRGEKMFKGLVFRKRWGPNSDLKTELQYQRFALRFFYRKFPNFLQEIENKKSWRNVTRDMATDEEYDAIMGKSHSERCSWKKADDFEGRGKDKKKRKNPFDITTESGRKAREKARKRWDEATEEGRKRREKARKRWDEATEEGRKRWDEATEEGRKRRENAREKTLLQFDENTEKGRKRRENARERALLQFYPVFIVTLIMSNVVEFATKCFAKLKIDKACIDKCMRLAKWPLVIVNSSGIKLYGIMFNPVPLSEKSDQTKIPTCNYVLGSFKKAGFNVCSWLVGDMIDWIFPHAKAFVLLTFKNFATSLDECLCKNLQQVKGYDDCLLATGGCHDFGAMKHFRKKNYSARELKKYRRKFFETLLSLYDGLLDQVGNNPNKKIWFYKLADEGYFLHPLAAARQKLPISCMKGEAAKDLLKLAKRKSRHYLNQLI